jgi:hypothetical protein
VGVTVLVDIVFLLPFSAFSCMGSVSVRNISLYSKLNRLSNHPRLAATSCAPQASKQNKPQKAQFSLFPRGGRVCALHHLCCPTITNVTSFRFAPAPQRYLFFISICGIFRARLSAASISQLPLQRMAATRPKPTTLPFLESFLPSPSEKDSSPPRSRRSA